ncbi:hypothetical protein J6590_014407 [Homalodisca vitripennis]|nr:hypothetical protein J6590_014407 [Homalodisca vitripennis]
MIANKKIVDNNECNQGNVENVALKRYVRTAASTHAGEEQAPALMSRSQPAILSQGPLSRIVDDLAIRRECYTYKSSLSPNSESVQLMTFTGECRLFLRHLLRYTDRKAEATITIMILSDLQITVLPKETLTPGRQGASTSNPYKNNLRAPNSPETNSTLAEQARRLEPVYQAARAHSRRDRFPCSTSRHGYWPHTCTINYAGLRGGGTLANDEETVAVRLVAVGRSEWSSDGRDSSRVRPGARSNKTQLSFPSAHLKQERAPLFETDAANPQHNLRTRLIRSQQPIARGHTSTARSRTDRRPLAATGANTTARRWRWRSSRGQGWTGQTSREGAN